jgi:hypothetical protein
MVSQENFALMAAPPVKPLMMAQKASHALPDGAGHTVHPTGISLLAQTEGVMVLVR